MPRVVPFTGGEKESLHEALDRHRDVVLWKLEGLDDEQLRRSMTPTGTNLLGLVKHLASVEFGWFCGSFGRPSEALPFDEADPGADMRVAARRDDRRHHRLLRTGPGGRRSGRRRDRPRRPRHALERCADIDALGAHPHARGDGPPRRPHGHPPGAHRRRHRSAATRLTTRSWARRLTYPFGHGCAHRARRRGAQRLVPPRRRALRGGPEAVRRRRGGPRLRHELVSGVGPPGQGAGAAWPS